MERTLHWTDDLRERIFRKGIRRTAQRIRSRLFLRTTEEDLAQAIRSLGIPAGSVIAIHGMLSGLGYLVGGPESVIRAVRKAVPDCTLLMPTFPFDYTMEAYLSRDPIFDPARTPSRSGLLSEAFRLMPGVLRGYHPTHPSAAIGPLAAQLIDGSENAQTPFGPESAYGRYAALENAYQLLLHTNSTSIVHCFQERSQMPNLFRAEGAPARYLDADGRVQTTLVRVFVPLLPLFVAVPGDQRDEVSYVWYPDYVLPMPGYNRVRIENNLKSRSARELILSRHERMIADGVIRIVKLRDAELAAIRVAPWADRICHDVRASFEACPQAYTEGALLRAKELGLLRS